MTSEYKVIVLDKVIDANELTTRLNNQVPDGWKPILMSTVSSTAGIVHTVILERILGQESGGGSSFKLQRGIMGRRR
jgi:hypothetical protein